jgi:hypothetical protein
MLKGIYRVEFQSSLATVGDGIVVFDACGVHGANDTHVYRGVQEGFGDALRLDVEIRHLRGEKYPSFGALSAVNLDLEVSEITPEGFRAVGAVREASNIRLHVFGHKLADLADLTLLTGPDEPCFPDGE